MTEQEEAILIREKFGASLDNAEQPWSVSLLPGDQLRFEVRPGDVWVNDTGLGKERSEIAQYGRLWPFGTPVEVNYRMMIEPGPVNTSYWVVLGQLHTAQWNLPGVASPPFSVNLQGEKLAFAIRNIPNPSADKPDTPGTLLYRSPTDIVRGAWYDIKIHILPDGTRGGGYVDVWINGVQVVNYDGPIGYGSDTLGYVWKQGIYRAASNETLVLNIDDLTVYGQQTDFTGTQGDDVFRFDNPGDRILGTQAGIDEIRTAMLVYSLPDGVEKLSFIDGGRSYFTGTGNALDNTITGAARGDTLYGGLGNDTLLGLESDDWLYGGQGNDSLDGGINTDVAYGGAGNDTLIAGSVTDSVYGGAGDDLLDATGNPGYLEGGAGNDTYTYLGALPTIVETADGGIDTIRTERFVAELPQFIENLVMLGASGAANGNALDNQITGNASDNSIQAQAGNDTLFGLGGVDRLNGDTGNDSLYGGDGNDTLRGGEGNDTLFGGAGADSLIGGAGVDVVSYADLTDGIVATLNASGGGTVTGASSGNDALAEIEAVIGSAGNDTLNAGQSSDSLYGGNGNDLLDAKATTARLEGGAGNDTYLFSGALPTIIEMAEGGIDTVRTDRLVAELPQCVENLVMLGTLASSNGNALANEITGNASDNIIQGLGGNDTLNGLGGADRLGGDGGNDLLSGGEGNDTLRGDDGSDTLFGGAGADSLIGGAGIDVASYADLSDGVVVTLNAAGGGTVTGASSGSDTLAEIEAVVGTAGNDTLTAGRAADSLYGGTGDDLLDAGGTAAWLEGGAGNDTYVISAAPATMVEMAGGGIDTIRTDRFLAELPQFIENLVMLGALEASNGNALDNRITGNASGNSIQGLAGNDTLTGLGGADRLFGDAGNDLLEGGEGNDTLSGGLGDDTLTGGAGTDSVTYAELTDGIVAVLNAAGGGTVTGASSGTDTLGEVETIIGTAGQDNLSAALTGNRGETFEGLAGADTLAGGGGNDTLFGGLGTDTLTGGDGDDLLYGGMQGDLLDGGEGTDTVVYADAVSARVDLMITGEQRTGQGPDTLISIENLTGSAFSDWLGGNMSSNVLIGGDGDDSIFGRAGDDTVIGGAGNDQMMGGAGIDTVMFQGSAAATADLMMVGPQNTGHGIDSFALFENLAGGDGNDVLWGDLNNNVLTGSAGNDVLRGRLGNDTLDGGAGQDSLWGGAGNDVLRGGGGSDQFVFWQGAGADRITDFDPTQDKIRFESGAASMGGLGVETQGADLVIRYLDNSITLDGMAGVLLTADHFIFG